MNYVTLKYAEKNISANKLKFIAIIAMIIDHIAVSFVSNQSILGQAMHMIGRISMPIMCYFIAEGYYKTHNVKKYALRLFLFSLISYYPFYLFAKGVPPISFGENIIINSDITMNTMFILFLGLIALIVWDNKNMKIYIKIPFIFLICIFSTIADWGYIGVLWIVIFGANYGKLKNQLLGFLLISMILILRPILMLLNITNGIWLEQVYQLGILLPIPLLIQYNGRLGNSKNTKWAFYIFYPLHLLILGYIKYYII